LTGACDSLLTTKCQWYFPKQQGSIQTLRQWNREAAMSMDISRETEDRLAAEARRLGISVDALLTRLMGARAEQTSRAGSRPALPVWHLGSVGALHRRDIYDDAH